MKKRILIITTGGTIAMQYKPDVGVVPSPDLVEFLHTFPQLEAVAQVQVHEFANLPSPHITPAKMMELARLADISAVDYDGIVITHGTDTLEETAYLLKLVCTTRKPIIFTAAMRSGSDLGLDGPRNIVGAVRTACCEEAYDQGVLVVMNDEIHDARDVTKSDTGKIDSFVSPDHGLLGVVDADRVVFFRRSLVHDEVWTDTIDDRVEMLKITAGMSSVFIEAAIANKTHGLVLEALGRGNVPPNLVPAIEEALAAGVVVVICSRAYKGRVLPEYGYQGGGLHLQKLGCLLAGDLKGIKARLKLMALFGKYQQADLVKKFFATEV